MTAAQPMHVKIMAIPFAIFGPLFGYGTLSAEPYNLLFYATVIALVFTMGREVGSRRVGLLAGAVVAVYPSFLLHTMQLLKDPLVVTASLAFVLGVTTWLTRTYSAKSAAVAAVLTMLITLLLFFARANLLIVFFATALLGLTLLVMRQLLERRYLLWNMIFTLAHLVSNGFSVLFSSSLVTNRRKDETIPWAVAPYRFHDEISVNPEEEMNTLRPLTVVILLAFALGMNACSSIRHHSSEAKYSDHPLSERGPSSQNRAGWDDARVNRDFSLINLTGAPVTGVYLSPSASSGWEENILAGSDLKSGNTLNIRFNPNETAVTWNMRIEGADGHYAEWKNLNLGDTSQITLRLELSPRLTAVAEVE